MNSCHPRKWVKGYTSSKTGTLTPTRPVFPPWGTTAKFLELQYLRIWETCKMETQNEANFQMLHWTKVLKGNCSFYSTEAKQIIIIIIIIIIINNKRTWSAVLGCNNSLLEPLYLCIQSVFEVTSLPSSWTTFLVPNIPSKYRTSSSFNFENLGFLWTDPAIEPKHLHWIPTPHCLVSAKFLEGLKNDKTWWSLRTILLGNCVNFSSKDVPEVNQEHDVAEGRRGGFLRRLKKGFKERKWKVEDVVCIFYSMVLTRRFSCSEFWHTVRHRWTHVNTRASYHLKNG